MFHIADFIDKYIYMHGNVKKSVAKALIDYLSSSLMQLANATLATGVEKKNDVSRILRISL